MFCIKCGTGLENGKCPNCGYIDETEIIPGQTQQTGEHSAPWEYPPPLPETSPQTQPQGYYSAPGKPVQTQQTGYYGSSGAYLPPLPETRSGKKTNIKKEKKPWTKKRKRTLAIILSSVAFILIAGGLVTGYLLLDEKYNDAIKDLEKDRPEAAAASFEEIKWFKDSDEYLEKCYTLIAYHEAEDTYDSKDYEAALVLFKNLGDYEDSEDYAQLCQQYIDYDEANSLFTTLSYEQAKVIFVALGDFEDSVNMAELCQVNIDYIKAKEYFELEDYEGAKTLFETIPDFEDSSDMLVYCEVMISYTEALQSMDKGSYSEAVLELKALEYDLMSTDLDFSEILPMEELKYNLGQSYYKQELYYSAYKEFKEAGNYQDAFSMANSCVKTSETGELYINPDYTKNTVKFTFYGVKDSNDDAFIEVYNGSVLVSTCYVKHGEKLKVYYPTGAYGFKVYYGDTWYGLKEKFGKSTYDENYGATLKSNYYYWIDL